MISTLQAFVSSGGFSTTQFFMAKSLYTPCHLLLQVGGKGSVVPFSLVSWHTNASLLAEFLGKPMFAEVHFAWMLGL